MGVTLATTTYAHTHIELIKSAYVHINVRV
jgi:hypothetical protein